MTTNLVPQIRVLGGGGGEASVGALEEDVEEEQPGQEEAAARIRPTKSAFLSSKAAIFQANFGSNRV